MGILASFRFCICHEYKNEESKAEAKPEEGTVERAKVTKPHEEMDKEKKF